MVYNQHKLYMMLIRKHLKKITLLSIVLAGVSLSSCSKECRCISTRTGNTYTAYAYGTSKCADIGSEDIPCYPE